MQDFPGHPAWGWRCVVVFFSRVWCACLNHRCTTPPTLNIWQWLCLYANVASGMGCLLVQLHLGRNPEEVGFCIEWVTLVDVVIPNLIDALWVAIISQGKGFSIFEALTPQEKRYSRDREISDEIYPDFQGCPMDGSGRLSPCLLLKDSVECGWLGWVSVDEKLFPTFLLCILMDGADSKTWRRLLR